MSWWVAVEAVDRGYAWPEELDPFVKSSVPWAATKCSSFSLVAGGSGSCRKSFVPITKSSSHSHALILCCYLKPTAC